MSGYIAMSREALDHPLLKDGERFRAWFWLVSKACWKPVRIDAAGQILELQRGQLCYSVRYLAEAWGWSKSTVDRFLHRLEGESMLSLTRSKTGTASGTGQFVITICNYDKYQKSDDDAGTAGGTGVGQQWDSSGTNKNKGNKVNKKKIDSGDSSKTPQGGEDDTTPPSSFDLKKLTFDHVCAHLIATGVAQSRAGTITAKWRQSYSDGQILDALRRCIEAKPAPPDPITFIFQQLKHAEQRTIPLARNPHHERRHQDQPSEPSDPLAAAAVRRQARRASAQRGEQDYRTQDGSYLEAVGD